MKKVLGTLVSLLPFLVLVGLAFYRNWILSAFLLCGIIGIFDIAGWVMWFWELGEKIKKS